MKKILIIVSVFILMISCQKKEPKTVQTYLASNISNPDFMVLSFPSFVIKKMFEEVQDVKTEELLGRFKNANVLLFKPRSKLDKSMIDKECSKIVKILKNSQYQSLIKVKHKGFNVKFLAKGDNSKDLIDELLVYATIPQQTEKKSGGSFCSVTTIIR